MFCPTANQSLETFKKVVTEDVELDKTVMELKDWNLLNRETQFADRSELGKVLIGLQNEVRAGRLLITITQTAVLDNALYQILGRRLYS